MKTAVATADGDDPRRVAETFRAPIKGFSNSVRALLDKKTDEVFDHMEKW